VTFSKGRIVIILDNARIHHAKLLQPYLDSIKERLELVFLPPYSPNLNIIEGLWKWLKSEVINNVFFSNVCQIQQSVRGFMKWIKDVIKVAVRNGVQQATSGLIESVREIEKAV